MNIDLICNLNSAVALSEGLQQEDQPVNLQTILLLHNWSTEDPEKTLQSSESQFPRAEHGLMEKQTKKSRTNRDHKSHQSAVIPTTRVKWDQVWTQPSQQSCRYLHTQVPLTISCFHLKPSLLPCCCINLSSFRHSSSIHPALCPPSSNTWVKDAKITVAWESVSVY